jgi:hypothetical protein
MRLTLLSFMSDLKVIRDFRNYFLEIRSNKLGAYDLAFLYSHPKYEELFGCIQFDWYNFEATPLLECIDEILTDRKNGGASDRYCTLMKLHKEIFG